MLVDWLVSLAAPPLCWSCGAPADPAVALCRDCRLRLRWLGPGGTSAAGVPAWAPVAYEGPARALVRGLKFRGAAGVAEAMAAQVVAAAPTGLLDRGALVPVPLHPVRLRRRGFNQAELLAAAVARRSGLALAPCLERRGDPSQQMGRPRAERLAALCGSVALAGEAPDRAVLVDDVITTGATLAACAEALRRGGSGAVTAVAYARTLGR